MHHYWEAVTAGFPRLGSGGLCWGALERAVGVGAADCVATRARSPAQAGVRSRDHHLCGRNDRELGGTWESALCSIEDRPFSVSVRELVDTDGGS